MKLSAKTLIYFFCSEIIIHHSILFGPSHSRSSIDTISSIEQTLPSTLSKKATKQKKAKEDNLNDSQSSDSSESESKLKQHKTMSSTTALILELLKERDEQDQQILPTKHKLALLRNAIKNVYELSDEEIVMTPTKFDTQQKLILSATKFLGHFLYGGDGYSIAENTVNPENLFPFVLNSKRDQGINLIKLCNSETSNSDTLLQIQQIINIQSTINNLNKDISGLPVLTVIILFNRINKNKKVPEAIISDFVTKIKATGLDEETLTLFQQSLFLAQDVAFDIKEARILQTISEELIQEIQKIIYPNNKKKYSSSSSLDSNLCRPSSSFFGQQFKGKKGFFSPQQKPLFADGIFDGKPNDSSKNPKNRITKKLQTLFSRRNTNSNTIAFSPRHSIAPVTPPPTPKEEPSSSFFLKRKKPE